MRVFKDLNQLPVFKNAVITIGSFDGVHSGHQAILNRINTLARRIDGESVVVTFHPHPRQIIYPSDKTLRLLTNITEKTALLASYGVDNLVIVPFSVEFSQMSADEYILKFLVELFRPRYIVIGYDHRFGLNRQGDVNYLRWYGKMAGYEVVEIEKQQVEDISVSSTKIRRALSEGDIQAANALLGHPFTLGGKVVHGAKIGAKIGFPTANVATGDAHKIVPRQGIYAVYVEHEGQRYKGMLYIGNRPTVEDAGHQSIEVNIFGFSGNLYGEHIQLSLIDFVRADVKFPKIEELKDQLAIDRLAAESMLRAHEERRATAPLPPAQVAIVILNYNGRHHLQAYLPRLLAEPLPLGASIWVADNGSADGSGEWLARAHPDVRQIAMRENKGFAGGYNEALQHIAADYYMLLNSDVAVQPGWLSPLLLCLQANPQVAACQPKILSDEAPENFEYAGAAGGWIDALGYPFCRGRIFSDVEADEGQYDDASEIFWASGAALLIRTELYHRIGGFDADYFAHSEEIDLCWRLKRAGWQVMVVPDSTVWHLGGGTLSYDSPSKVHLNFRNSLYTLFKNEPATTLLWLLPLRLVLDGVAGLLFLSQGKYDHIRAIFRAHWDFFPHLGKLYQKRAMYKKRIQASTIAAPNVDTGRLRGSVVWAYFVEGKRTFRELF